MAAVTVVVVITRYLLDESAIILQESVIYMHALSFMLGIAYTLKSNDHVRVDIIYSRLSVRARLWIDLCGHCLFLLPFTLVIFYYSTPYVVASWRVLEGSSEVGGIPGIFLLKSVILVMATTLLLQTLAEIFRTAHSLSHHTTDKPTHGQGPVG